MVTLCCALLLARCARGMHDDLIAAAEAGDTAAVLQLLADGATINGRDARGRTAAMAATHGNRVETVGALIRAGVDINRRDNCRENVPLYVGAEGLLDILNLAIDVGADTRLTNRFGWTALLEAIILSNGDENHQ